MFVNNSTIMNVVANDTKCQLTDAIYIISTYVNTAISVVGLITNSICIVVFTMIIMGEKSLPGQMFKYLLFKAIYDTAQFWIQVFAPLYFCPTCSTYETYGSQLWYVWFYYYAENLFELASGFLEVAATFDCLITVKQMFPRLKTNRACLIFVTIVSVYSTLFYIFRIFTYNIVEIQAVKRNETIGNNETSLVLTPSRFVLQASEFSKTALSETLGLMHTASRDAFVMIVTLILNMFLLMTLKDAVKLKKRMTTSRTIASRT